MSGNGNSDLVMMEGYVPTPSVKPRQQEQGSEEDDEKNDEGEDLAGSWRGPFAAPQSHSPAAESSRPVSQELPYMVKGRYAPTALAFIARHKMKLADYPAARGVVQDAQKRKMMSFYEQNGKKVALFEPVIDSLAPESEKTMYTLSFALKKYQEYIVGKKQNTCDELIIPLAKNGQVWGANIYQHWVFLHIKYDANTDDYNAVLHDSKAYLGPGYFYRNDAIESAVKSAFAKSNVAFDAKYHGAQGVLNNGKRSTNYTY